MAENVWLIRHAATEWSVSGQHTGRTDIPLLEEGRDAARKLPGRLAGQTFARVLVSPLGRARETAELAGLMDDAELRDDLMEWDYGDYEGLTTPRDPRAPPALVPVARRRAQRRDRRPGRRPRRPHHRRDRPGGGRRRARRPRARAAGAGGALARGRRPRSARGCTSGRPRSACSAGSATCASSTAGTRPDPGVTSSGHEGPAGAGGARRGDGRRQRLDLDARAAARPVGGLARRRRPRPLDGRGLRGGRGDVRRLPGADPPARRARRRATTASRAGAGRSAATRRGCGR